MSSFNQLAPSVPTILNTSNCFIFSNSSSGNALSVQQLGAGNVVSFSNASGGSNVFVMNNLGRVGLGTTNPNANFHIYGASPYLGISDSSAATDTKNWWQSYSGANAIFYCANDANNASGQWMIVNRSGYTPQYILWLTGGTERMRIDSSGRVGIGSASPITALDIASGTISGSAGNTTWRIQPQYVNSSPFPSQVRIANGWDPVAGTGQANYAGVGINLNSSQGGSGIEFYTSTTNNAVPSRRVTINGSGNVGIGTTSPFTPLHVSTTQSAANSSGNMTNGFAVSDGDGGPALNMGVYNSGGTQYGWLQSAFINNAGVTRPIVLNPVSGNVGIGTTNPTLPFTIYSASTSISIFALFGGANWSVAMNTADTHAGWNAAASVIYVAKNSATNRSLNAAGTVNASGADYAEYMTKTSDFSIKKGDVVGVNSHGFLTNVFSESVTFVVKSTDPSYVGGDTWGSEEAIGMTSPDKTPQKENESDEDYAKRQQALDQFNAKLEEARARVDRIAFAGQVPVNVLGATPGQYIVPVANDDGSIGGQAVSSPTFEQYMAAVGKVINVLPDGRAQIIVKVV